MGVNSVLSLNEVLAVWNDFWKGSKLCVEFVSVVVFVCWKFFKDHVHFFISLNVGLFHLLLPDN